MKPFSLHTVLNYRQRLEDMAQNGLAKAQQAEELARRELEQERDRHQAVISMIERIQREGVGITELIRYEDHLVQVKERLGKLDEQLEKRKQDVEQARRQLLKKSRERQAMEKLRERQDAAWKVYLNKKEAAMLDEIAIIFNEKNR